MGHPESAGHLRSCPDRAIGCLNLGDARMRNRVQSKACTAFSGGGAARLERCHIKGLPSSRMNVVDTLNNDHIFRNECLWIVDCCFVASLANVCVVLLFCDSQFLVKRTPSLGIIFVVYCRAQDM